MNSASPLVSFCGGDVGAWRVDSITAVRGEALARVARVAHVAHVEGAVFDTALWVLRGARSNARYITRAEHETLAAVQEGLGRPQARAAALIPIRKSAAWWELTQDERREIFEEKSGHVASTLGFLPAIARRLHHSRDLGEPFDFLTWFEFAPEDTGRFDELLALLRATPEWSFVEREVDVRLSRVVEGGAP